MSSDELEPTGTAMEVFDQASKTADAIKAPVLLTQGTFAMYATPRGGLVLVVDVDGKTYRKKVPGPLLKMFARGPLGKAFRNGGEDEDGMDEQPDE